MPTKSPAPSGSRSSRGVPSGSRRCRKCGGAFPEWHFYRHAAAADGLRSECKDCHYKINYGKDRQRARDLGTRPPNVPKPRFVAGPPGLHLVFTDPHLPHIDQQAWSPLRAYMADQRWDGVHCLGDLLDNEAISQFAVGRPRRLMSALTVLEQFERGKAFCAEWVAAARAKNRAAVLTLLEGNHEERTERFVDVHPQLEGLVDVERGLDLKSQGIRYLRSWSQGEMLQLGRLSLGHGSYATANHAAAHVRHYGCNMLYGHTHDVQAYSIRRRGPGTPITAQSIGCLCRYDQAYMRGRPHNWEHAFAVVWVWPDGCFQHVVVRIINGRFIGPTNGREYRA